MDFVFQEAAASFFLGAASVPTQYPKKKHILVKYET